MALAILDQTRLLYTQKYDVSKLCFNRALKLNRLNYNRYISGGDKFRLLFSHPEQKNMSNFLNFNFLPTNPLLFQMSDLFHFRLKYNFYLYFNMFLYFYLFSFSFWSENKLHFNEFYNLHFQFNLLIYSVLKNTLERCINYFLV